MRQPPARMLQGQLLILILFSSVRAWTRTDLSDLAALRCDIDRRDGNTLSTEDFWREYASARKPLIITSLVIDRWPAATLWQPESLMSSSLGEAKTISPSRNLREQLHIYGHPKETERDSPKYYWDSSFFERNPSWKNHFKVEQ